MIKQNFNKVLSEPFSLSLFVLSFFIYSLVWVIGLNSNWFVMADLLGIMLLFRYLLNNLEFNFFEIKPKSKIEVYLKTLKVLENVELPFEILNYVVAPKTNLSITKNIFVK